MYLFFCTLFLFIIMGLSVNLSRNYIQGSESKATRYKILNSLTPLSPSAQLQPTYVSLYLLPMLLLNLSNESKPTVLLSPPQLFNLKRT